MHPVGDSAFEHGWATAQLGGRRQMVDPQAAGLSRSLLECFVRARINASGFAPDATDPCGYPCFG
jgi:hypothetical protein